MAIQGITHGVDINSPFFQGWLVGVPITYFALLALFRALNWWDFPTRKGSRASDIMAFEIVAGLCVTYLAIAGVIGSYGLFGFENESVRLSANPFYERSHFVEDHLVYPMISYQGWNFLLCLVNADLRDPAMIGHHVVTGTLAYFGLFPYLHYKGLFYMGVAELTNVPLTIVDIFKYFPDMAKKYSGLNEFSRISFALSFVLIRLLYWPYFSLDFWRGSIELIASGKAHSNFVVGFFLAANVFLTGLQFFWGSKIFGFLFKKPKDVKKAK